MRLSDKAEFAGTPIHWPNGRARGVQHVSYAHAAIIDAMIADPCVSQYELACRFGYSAGWISQIIASNAFQTRLAERTGELVDPTIRATVDQRFKALVLRTLGILQEKLDRPTAQISDHLVLRALEVSCRAAAARVEQPALQVNIENHLQVLGDNLTRLLHRKKAGADQPIDPEEQFA